MKRIRKWIQRWIYVEELKESERKIGELNKRMEVTHKRMQEMYWDERSKNASLGLIELLQEEIHRIDPENELLQKIRAAAAGGI
jgi:hypothetical protein